MPVAAFHRQNGASALIAGGRSRPLPLRAESRRGLRDLRRSLLLWLLSGVAGDILAAGQVSPADAGCDVGIAFTGAILLVAAFALVCVSALRHWRCL